MSDEINMNQRSRRVLTDLRKILKPMSIPQRAEYLNTPKWRDFFDSMPCPKILQDEFEPELLELYEKGYTYRQIEDHLGVSVHNIQQAAIKNGLESRKTQRRLEKEDVFFIYEHDEMTVRQLAEKLGTCIGTISRTRRGDGYKEFYEEYYDTTTNDEDTASTAGN